MQRFVDEDTWQLARFLLERRPTTAFEDAITRAQAARRRGDTMEFKAWLAIADAVQELERPARPSDQIH